MKLAKIVVLVASLALLAGCATTEEAIDAHGDAQSRCISQVNPTQPAGSKARDLEIKAGAQICMDEWARKNPRLAELYDRYHSRHGYAYSPGPSSEIIILDQHGNYRGGIEYYDSGIAIAR